MGQKYVWEVPESRQKLAKHAEIRRAAKGCRKLRGVKHTIRPLPQKWWELQSWFWRARSIVCFPPQNRMIRFVPLFAKNAHIPVCFGNVNRF